MPLGGATTRRKEPADALVWLLLAASVVFAGVFAATRNVYDDEVGSFRRLVLPLGELWRGANASDIHPPLSYALSRFFLEATGSVRLMMVGPLLFLYGGLAVFVGALLRAGVLRGTSRLVFAGAALLHPQILMWGSSTRWQAYWSGLAWLVLALSLALHREPEDDVLETPALPVLVVVGVVLGVMVYVNYLTLLLMGALVLGWAVRFAVTPRAMGRLAIPLALAGLIGLPQLGPVLQVHLENAVGQTRSLLDALIKILPGAVVGQAMLPWNPVAPAFGLLAAAAGVVLLLHARRHLASAGGMLRGLQRASPAWLSLFLVYLAVMVAAVVTGLGRKPRSFVFLSPIFAYLLALAWQWTPSRRARAVAAVVVGIWLAVSGYDLLAKVGTSKGGFNDHYDEVIAVARETPGRPVVFFTHDPALAFAIHEAAAREGQPWTACAVTVDWYHGRPCATATRQELAADRVILVGGYPGSLAASLRELAAAQQAVLDAIWVDRRVHASRDRDAAMKRRLPNVYAKLSPDYRFTLYVGRPNPDADLAELARRYRAVATTTVGRRAGA